MGSSADWEEEEGVGAQRLLVSLLAGWEDSGVEREDRRAEGCQEATLAYTMRRKPAEQRTRTPLLSASDV